MQLRQRVRYVTASDGTRLAWAEAGAGGPLVKAANWLTHLEYEWESPVWRHWIRFFSSHFRFIRHPERVAQMVLYGGYAHGACRRGTAPDEKAYRAMIELARVAWSAGNPTFRQVFTSRFIPGGTPEQLQWFNDLCVKSTTGEIAAALFESRAMVDIAELLPQVRTPTLVLHARKDEVVPISEGRLLASAISGAEFVELDSRNHVLLEHEPAWNRFCEAVLSFLAPAASLEARVLAALSARELQVLTLMSEGLSNARIAEHLKIGEKTVRNHASNLFDKIGVRSRAQAIVFARDHGLRGK